MLQRKKTPHHVPRYFALQYQSDVIVLDINDDKYLWKRDIVLDASVNRDDDSTDGSVAMPTISLPKHDGFPPRGPGRYWKVDHGLILEALYLLLEAVIVSSKGFKAVVAYMNRTVIARGSLERTASLRQLAFAVELARLLCPFKAKCLPVSLATARLARRRGLDVVVVVGVRALPLQAHAWAQAGEELVGDTLDRVLQFRPIMQLPLIV